MLVLQIFAPSCLQYFVVQFQITLFMRKSFFLRFLVQHNLIVNHGKCGFKCFFSVFVDLKVGVFSINLNDSGLFFSLFAFMFSYCVSNWHNNQRQFYWDPIFSLMKNNLSCVSKLREWPNFKLSSSHNLPFWKMPMIKQLKNQVNQTKCLTHQ